MKKTKKVKMFSRDYGFEKSQTPNIQKIFGLFQAKNIFIEIINIEKDSNFTNLSLEDFLSYDRKRYGVKMITQQIVVCACEAMFDENVISITFNADLFYPRDYVSKIDEIFLEEY